MNIAYLVNQYPQPTHTFIRREIAALEAAGITVHRFALRRWGEHLVDADDRSENSRTRFVLEGGKPASAMRLAGALLRAAFCEPNRFWRAFGKAMELGRNSDRGRLINLVYLAEACVLTRWFRACNAEHVHAHFGTNPAAVALLVWMLGGPPYSFTAHGPEEFEKAKELKLRTKVEGARFVVVVSESGRALLQQECDEEFWSKIHVIHCGVDTNALYARSKANGHLAHPDPLRFVCVGRLCARKGQMTLLEAAARLAAEGMPFELTLAGDGPMRLELEDRIKQLGLERCVRLTGWLDSEGVFREILSSRALVLASFAEGLPVVLMEAMALGKPVVATQIAGIPELVTDGTHGYLVPAGDVQALAAAMRKVFFLSGRELQAMGNAATEKVAQLHDSKTEAARLAGLFAARVPSEQRVQIKA